MYNGDFNAVFSLNKDKKLDHAEFFGAVEILKADSSDPIAGDQIFADDTWFWEFTFLEDQFKLLCWIQMDESPSWNFYVDTIGQLYYTISSVYWFWRFKQAAGILGEGEKQMAL